MAKDSVRRLARIAAASAAVLAVLGAARASAATWGKDYFPNLPVVTHEGQTVKFYDDLIKGRIVVISFVYTVCPDICSLTTARLAEVYERLGERAGRDVFLYSVTLDPERDTPEVLKRYGQAFGAGPGWSFLTGKPEDLEVIRWKLGERSRNLSEHRTDMVLGNDATGEWSRISVMGELAIVAEQILDMDPTRRARVRAASATGTPAGRPLADHPGEALFLKACSYCHSVGQGVRIGPDLQGVTARRSRDWLARFMMAPDAMLARRDPVAVTLNNAYPDVVMPNLGLSKDDVQDLMTYLAAETDRAVKQPARHEPHDHQHHPH